jgi:hypothetical protein
VLSGVGMGAETLGKRSRAVAKKSPLVIPPHRARHGSFVSPVFSARILITRKVIGHVEVFNDVFAVISCCIGGSRQFVAGAYS